MVEIIHNNQLNNHEYGGIGRSSRRLLTDNNKLCILKKTTPRSVGGFSHLSPD